MFGVKRKYLISLEHMLSQKNHLLECSMGLSWLNKDQQEGLNNADDDKEKGLSALLTKLRENHYGHNVVPFL